ncbi:unnamed protein product [Porites evermanni]|uniref:HIRAN domain-containing protein n=1 Tax=Porites evermanni TaxID=104178 RepID=A0ABN8QZV6_9CNID|nr:unnamed protein product [Porites evermanni]CAH3015573.1 unnamed protein product [Porites evermanni]CAH3018999.1 unnamed protein product [Porites evermanni]CAH3028557.1 unnamed protein product [Porites evermanni]CAH3156175.1 unnamed protein product [Porites evermanni]
MEATTYSFRSCIRGYHVYKDIWDSVVGEVLDCEHEPDNPHDTHAVAVKRVQDQGGMQQIVGHVPLTLSRVFHLFLKHGGQISVEVTGKRRNKGIGLEIPATYLFYHKKPSKVKKLIELIRDKEESRS